MKRLTDEQIEKKIQDAFENQTGLLALEVSHIFPCSLETTVHTNDRTFTGKLTYTGRPKRNSFKEDEGSFDAYMEAKENKNKYRFAHRSPFGL